MTERVFARPLPGGLWQWRMVDSDGQWLSAPSNGDGDALYEALSANTPLCVMLDGRSVIATSVEIDAKERRHVAKLLPFELEESVIDAVDDLHFVHAEGEGDSISVLYARTSFISDALQHLADLEGDIFHLLPDYLFLPVPESGATLLVDSGMVFVRLDAQTGFTVDSRMAPQIIPRLDKVYESSAQIQLIAEDEPQLALLKTYLPESWLADDGPEVTCQLGRLWDCIDVQLESCPLNMRRGIFGRSLPIERWLSLWKVPAIAIAVAFVLAIGANFGAYMSAKSESKQLRADTLALYMKAVPTGKRSEMDPERQLKSKLKASGSSNDEPSNFIYLLSRVSEALAENKKASISNFRYDGQQRQLQLTLEVESIGDVGKLRNLLQAKGVSSEPPRTNKSGNKYQARLKIEEAGS